MYLAVFEPCRRRTEDKVGGALDITVLEKQPRAGYAGVYCVLMAEQTAVYEYQAVALCVQCHGLTEACRVVLDGDVLECDAASFHLHRICSESAHAFARERIDDVGMVIVGDDGGVAVFAEYLDVGEPLRYDELLFVYAFLYVYHLVILHECPAHFHGLGNGAEFACTVACHNDGVGVVVFVCR